MENQPQETGGRRLPLFIVGVLLFVIGPIAYFIQMRFSFIVPWYMPILSTLGVVLMAVSVWQHRGVLRSIGLVVFLIFCGLQWAFFTIFARTPDYTGPAQVGSPLPKFSATRADGKTPFTESELDSKQHTVMLFNRGRW